MYYVINKATKQYYRLLNSRLKWLFLALVSIILFILVAGQSAAKNIKNLIGFEETYNASDSTKLNLSAESVNLTPKPNIQVTQPNVNSQQSNTLTTQSNLHDSASNELTITTETTHNNNSSNSSVTVNGRKVPKSQYGNTQYYTTEDGSNISLDVQSDSDSGSNNSVNISVDGSNNQNGGN